MSALKNSRFRNIDLTILERELIPESKFNLDLTFFIFDSIYLGSISMVKSSNERSKIPRTLLIIDLI
jgi:hypothetical protein